jgi:hypothetical protein
VGNLLILLGEMWESKTAVSRWRSNQLSYEPTGAKSRGSATPNSTVRSSGSQLAHTRFYVFGLTVRGLEFAPSASGEPSDLEQLPTHQRAVIG